MLSRTTPRGLQRLLRSSSCSLRTVQSSSVTTVRSSTITSTLTSARPASTVQVSRFHSTPLRHKGLRPESSEPAPPEPEDSKVAGASRHVLEASPLSDAEYRDFSEQYFNALLGELESKQENGSDIEAEYSAGVLNVTVPGIGTYVLNKQPPNRQIWLSSPISGPKRYDWVLRGDAMDEKEGTREYVGGQWIYLRDGSNLTTLLNEELGVEMDYNMYAQAQ